MRIHIGESVGKASLEIWNAEMSLRGYYENDYFVCDPRVPAFDIFKASQIANVIIWNRAGRYVMEENIDGIVLGFTE